MTTTALNETTAKKDRLSIRDVLTNFAPRRFICNQNALELLKQMKVSEKLIATVEKTLEKDKTYFDQSINKRLDAINIGPQQRTRILDTCAIAAYHIQTDYPVVPCLSR